MSEPDANKLPVLTDIVQPLPEPGALSAELLAQSLPSLVREALQEVQPQLERQLLAALMPRLLAALSLHKAEVTSAPLEGAQRLP